MSGIVCKEAPASEGVKSESIELVIGMGSEILPWIRWRR